MAHPLPPAAPAASLRRRLFWLLLAVATLPAAAAIAISWLAAVQVLQTTARRDAVAKAYEAGRAVGEQIQSHALALSAEAARDDLRASASAFVRAGVPLDCPPPSIPGLRVFLLNEAGRAVAEARDGEWIVLAREPSFLAESGLPEAMALRLEQGLVLAEARDAPEAGGGAVLLFAVHLGRGRESPLSLAAAAPAEALLREAVRDDAQGIARFLLVSRRLGVVAASRPESSLDEAIDRIRPQLFYSEPQEDLERLAAGSSTYGVAAAQIRVARNLSMQARPGRPLVEWAVAGAIDLDALLAPVRRMQWILVMGAVLLVFAAAALASFVSGRLVRPIQTLTVGMQEFARGRLGYRVEVRTRDELQALAEAANEMARRLQAADAVNLQRLRELDEKAGQIELIHSISHSVNRYLDLEKLFERITRELREHIPCERLSLALLSEDRSRLVLEQVYPPDRPSLPAGSGIRPEDSLLWRALRDGGVALHRLGAGTAYEDRELTALGMRVLCVVPLTTADGPIGTLNLAASDPAAIGPAHLKLLASVAEGLALAVEHGRLYQKSEQFAVRLEEMVEERTAQLRRAQARLSAAERFAAAGSMAAHIAHEVNNPLSIIKNYLRIVGARVVRAPAEPDAAGAALEGLRVIEDEIDRIARIVAQLRRIGRPEKPEVRETDLGDEVRRVAELFEGTTRRKDIALEVEVAPGLHRVPLCRDHLRQILVNLGRNAIDAMEDGGGVLSITAKPDPEAPDARVRIEVADTGEGIPAELKRRIFDPFFTTKGEGKGSGLGLSLSQSLAHSMGGELEAFSQAGEGTVVRLTIPLRPDGIPPEEDDRPSADYVRREGGKVIIG